MAIKTGVQSEILKENNMKCSFELPVTLLKRNNFYRIRNKTGGVVADFMNCSEAEYIEQAINSHEKLVEYARHKKDCKKGRSDTADGNYGYYSCTCGFEQALKEAEKP